MLVLFGCANSPAVLGSHMVTLHLSEQEVADISEALDSPDIGDRAKRKLLVITMHHGGAGAGFITRCMRISAGTHTAYLKEYRDGGLAGVLEDRYYKPSSSIAPFLQCLECSFRVAPPACAAAASRITAMTGVVLTESQCRRVMKGMGMALRKCGQVPAKADPQLQLEFYACELLPRLEQASRGGRKVYFVDAAHFVLGGFLGMVWCFARQFVRTSPGRQRYSVLGAIESHTKEFVSIRTAGNVDSMTVCELLEEICRRHPEGEVTLVMDNARYQRNGLVAEAAAGYGIELLFLPSYSPNLNLIERLWKLAKKRCLANRYYENFGKFTAAIDSCLDSFATTLLPEVKSLLTLNFQFFGNRKT